MEGPDEISVKNFEKAQQALDEESATLKKLLEKNGDRYDDRLAIIEARADVRDAQDKLEVAKGYDEALKQNQEIIELATAKEEAEAQMLEELRNEGGETKE